MPVPFGGWTSFTPLPTPKVWTTPTEGFPGSPTIAIAMVTTPRLATGRTDELELVLVLVDDLWLEHAVAPTDSTASRPTSASRCHRTKSLLDRVRVRVAAAWSSVVGRGARGRPRRRVRAERARRSRITSGGKEMLPRVAPRARGCPPTCSQTPGPDRRSPA